MQDAALLALVGLAGTGLGTIIGWQVQLLRISKELLDTRTSIAGAQTGVALGFLQAAEHMREMNRRGEGALLTLRAISLLDETETQIQGGSVLRRRLEANGRAFDAKDALTHMEFYATGLDINSEAGLRFLAKQTNPGLGPKKIEQLVRELLKRRAARDRVTRRAKVAEAKAVDED